MRISNFWLFITRSGKHQYRGDLFIELKLFVMAQIIRVLMFILAHFVSKNPKIIFERHEFGFVLNSTYYLLDNSGMFSIASKVCTDLMKVETRIDKVSMRFGAMLQKTFFFENPWQRYFCSKGNDLRLEKSENYKDIGYPVDWWGSSYIELPLHIFSLRVNQKFSVSKEVISIHEKLIAKYDLEFEKIIGVHIRGTDKVKEIEQSSLDVFITEIGKQLKKFPNHKVLLLTDDNKVQSFMKSYFKENIFCFNEIKPSKKISGSHNQLNKNPILFTQTYLAAVLILSRCAILITHTGNGALWEFIIRANPNNSNVYTTFQL
jgi:hypothetical protein